MSRLDAAVDAIFRPRPDGPRASEAADSIPALKSGALPEWHFPDPIPASGLGAGDAIAFLWAGYLAKGYVTLLSGLWKAGKSTLIGHLLRASGDGGELAGRVEPARVLIVTEEGCGLWAGRRDDLSIGDHCEFLCRPFKVRPTPHRWQGFIEYIAGLIRDRRFDLVIFDTIAGLLPIVSENDAAQVQSALMPLHQLTELGAAVLLVHHPRKGDAGEGQAARGSGALPGFVDVILELRRYKADDREDCRRTLTAYSRFDETPAEAVIELTDSGYRLVGSKADAKRTDRMAVVADMLPGRTPGMTVEDIRDAWPDGGVPKPGLRTLRADLKAGTESGSWTSDGAGAKGDPFRYRADNSIPARSYPIGAGMESDPASATAPRRPDPAAELPQGAPEAPRRPEDRPESAEWPTIPDGTPEAVAGLASSRPGWTPQGWRDRLRQLAATCEAADPARAGKLRQAARLLDKESLRQS